MAGSMNNMPTEAIATQDPSSDCPQDSAITTNSQNSANSTENSSVLTTNLINSANLPQPDGSKIVDRLQRIASGVNENIQTYKENTVVRKMEQLNHERINLDAARAMSALGVFTARDYVAQQTHFRLVQNSVITAPPNIFAVPFPTAFIYIPLTPTYTFGINKGLPFQNHSTTYSRNDSYSAAAAEDGEDLSDADMASNYNFKYGRNRRKSNRKQSSSLNSNEASELSSFAKYINKIVREHLGCGQKSRMARLTFNGTIDDLEAHAQMLQKEGLGRIVEKEIRINQKNNRQSFIRMSTDRANGERDGMISILVARRYAFEGDTVRAFVLNGPGGGPQAAQKSNSFSDENDDEDDADLADTSAKAITLNSDTEEDPEYVASAEKSPKAFVITILKQALSRQIVGTIASKKKVVIHDKSYYKMRPYDKRMPLVYIEEGSCSAFIKGGNHNDNTNILYTARVVKTDVNGHCIGEILQEIGKEGILTNDLKAILVHNNLGNLEPYEQRINDMYEEPYKPIAEHELGYREDLRSKCVFTIDPLTAKDLDDALSIEYVRGGFYEVGIHISDVSYYLAEDSELDNIVKQRATSVYLANEVIHMLPKSLCMRCSLLPGLDKFTFSIFVRMDEDGKVHSHRIVRTVINSCTQFAYEHAQKFIDKPNTKFTEAGFPQIHNGFTVQNIKYCVLMLNRLAKVMRKKRYDNGAISIDKPKLRFDFDSITGEAAKFEVEQRDEANYLIEEFMLLANQIAGRSIHNKFPDTAILRSHGPPLGNGLKSVQERLKKWGFAFDCSSSKAIYESIRRMCAEAADPNAMYAFLCNALTKTMARANYICSFEKTLDDLRHYALCIPIYTHFTSPIRRYPDIMVHRQLAASLGYSEPSKRTPDEFMELAAISNVQKYNAKCASDESAELFFKRFIKAKQSLIMKAVVHEINQHSATVIVIKTGHVINLNYKDQKVDIDVKCVPLYIYISEKNSKLQPLRLKVLSTVDVKLAVYDNKLTGYFASPDIKQREMNSKVDAERRLLNTPRDMPFLEAYSIATGQHHQLQQLQQQNNAAREAANRQLQAGQRASSTTVTAAASATAVNSTTTITAPITTNSNDRETENTNEAAAGATGAAAAAATATGSAATPSVAAAAANTSSSSTSTTTNRRAAASSVPRANNGSGTSNRYLNKEQNRRRAVRKFFLKNN